MTTKIAIVTRNFLLRVWHDPAIFLVCVVGPIALGILILTPPFQAPDEHTHFFKAVQISEGRVVGKHIGSLPGYPIPVVGDELPAKYKITADHYSSLRVHLTEKASLSQIRQDLTHPSIRTDLIPTPFENTVVYSPVAYVPQAIAIAAVNMVNKAPLVQLYAARLVVLLISFTLLFLAIRRIPFGKWSVVALVATPMSLLLMGSCAGDALTISASVLFIACVLSAVVSKSKIRRQELVWIGILAILLGLCKSPYQLIVLFVLAIPMSRFSSKRVYYKVQALCIGLPLLLAAFWAAIVKDLYLNIVVGSSNAGQLQFIVHHPLGFLSALVRTYLGEAGDFLPRNFIDLASGPGAPLPVWFVVLNFLFIVLLLMLEPVRGAIRRQLKYASLLASAVFVSIFMALNLLLYVTFTPVAKPLIEGMQGRYFMPISYLLIPVAGGTLMTDSVRYGRILAVFRFFAMFSGVLSYYALFRRYY